MYSVTFSNKYLCKYLKLVVTFSFFFPLLKEAKARAKYSNQSTFTLQKRFFQFGKYSSLLNIFPQRYSGV